MPSFLKSAPRPSGAPMLRVRGGMGGGTSILERLKSLRKKDLAFIGAGLSVLVMAPLAEHFMMTPEDQGGAMKSGFSAPSSFPGDVGSIYDPGTGSFSPGGLLGQGSDVITPLNVRDPSALIMGPGATQKPAAAATVDSSASAAKPADNTAWKDALAAAQKGASAATRKASLPMPHPKLAAGMRGLGAVGGGGGGSFTLPGLSASNVPNRAGGGGSLTRAQAAPGYRGAAPRSNASGGNEGMKAAAGRQGDILNKGGGAAGALDQAAREAIPGGHNDVGGRPGGGDEFKSPSHADPKGNKSLGESLAFLKAKMEMEKQMELKWKKKMWNEFERGKMIEETIIKSALENILGKGIFEPMGKAMGDLFGSLTGADNGYICVYKAGPSAGSVAWKGSTEAYRKCKGDPTCATTTFDPAKVNCIPLSGQGTVDGATKDPNMSDASTVPSQVAGTKPGSADAAAISQQTQGQFGDAMTKYGASLGDISKQLKDSKAACGGDKACLDNVALGESAYGQMDGAFKSLQEIRKINGEANSKIKGANDAMKSLLTEEGKFLNSEQNTATGVNAAVGSKGKYVLNDEKPDYGVKAAQPGITAMNKEDLEKIATKEEDIKTRVETPLNEAKEKVATARQTLEQKVEAVYNNDGLQTSIENLSTNVADAQGKTAGAEGATAGTGNIAQKFSDAKTKLGEMNTAVKGALQRTDQARELAETTMAKLQAADARITGGGASAQSSVNAKQTVIDGKTAAAKANELATTLASPLGAGAVATVTKEQLTAALKEARTKQEAFSEVLTATAKAHKEAVDALGTGQTQAGTAPAPK
jgi:hypothetical protein